MGPQYGSIAVIMFRHTTGDIVTCTLNPIHLYKHKSGGGGRRVHSTAVVQQKSCFDTQQIMLYHVP